MPLKFNQGHNENSICPFLTLSLFNEWHSSSTSKKIKAVFEVNAKAGKYLGSKVPYGYNKGDDPNHLPVINPETAPIVKRIFDMRVQGMSPLKICAVLNEEGVLSPAEYYYQQRGENDPQNNKHLLGRTTLSHILHNPMYLGHLVQLKQTSVSHKNHQKIMKDESEWTVVENTHEPIITQKIWDRCREIDAEHTTGRVSSNKTVKPLSSLLYCADCGFRMTSAKSTNKVVYTTGNPHIVVWEFYKFSHQTSADKEKLQTAKKRITELDKLMQSAYADKVSGVMPASVCAKLLEQYEAEQNALTSQVQEIENRMLTLRQDERDVDKFTARLKKYQNAEVLTREMSLALIDAITIDECVRGKQERDIHIYYKFIDKGYSGKTE